MSQKSSKRKYILAIESSCDESAAAIIDMHGQIYADVVYSQGQIHAEYGGVVPEVAAREHIAQITPVVEAAFESAKIEKNEIAYVAATHAPGLIGPLWVGLQFAKGFALAQNIPFIGVHHLYGHIMAHAFEAESLQAPCVALIASGGHTALYYLKDWATVECIGETRDDAAGEAFDKSAKLLGFSYPGGQEIDQRAEQGDPRAHHFPFSFQSADQIEFSFSGLKNAFRLALLQKKENEAQLSEQSISDLCASLRYVVCETLILKSIQACQKYACQKLIVGGGVIANSYLRRELAQQCAAHQIVVQIPPRHRCTDNASMIARAALQKIRNGCGDEMHVSAQAWLPMGEAMLGTHQ